MKLARRRWGGAWPLLAICSLGCEAQPVLVVTLGNVPAAATTLEVSVKLGADASDEIDPIPLPSAGAAGSHTLGLRLPSQRKGTLLVGAGALDEAGCLLGVGFGEMAYNPAERHPQLTIVLDAPEGRACAGRGTPLLLRVTPPLAPTRGGARVAVRGWGFTRETRVLFGAKQAEATEWLSRSELAAYVPGYQGPLSAAPHPVQVVVDNGNGKVAVRTDLFAYVPSELAFEPGTPYPVASGPYALAVGLVDKDPWPDVVVASRDSGTVTVLRNTTLGALQPGTPVAAGTRPGAALLADVLPGDEGRPELVVASAGDNAVTVRRIDDSGALLSPTTYLVNLQPVALLAADLDRVVGLDLAVAHQVSRDVALLYTQGGRLDPAPRSLPVGRAPTALAAADLNGDGWTDLAVANRDSNTLSLLRSQGPDADWRVDEIPVGRGPIAVGAADLDGNGRAVLLVLNRGDHQLQVLRESTEGLGLGMPEVYPAGLEPAALAIGDLNADGRPEIAVASAGGNEVRLFRVDEQGRLQLAKQQGVGARPAALAISDLDRDGRADLIVSLLGAMGHEVLVLWNRSY